MFDEQNRAAFEIEQLTKERDELRNIIASLQASADEKNKTIDLLTEDVFALRVRLSAYEDGRPSQIILDAYCECLQIEVKKGRDNPFINEYHSIVKWICRIAGRAG